MVVAGFERVSPDCTKRYPEKPPPALDVIVSANLISHVPDGITIISAQFEKGVRHEQYAPASFVCYPCEFLVKCGQLGWRNVICHIVADAHIEGPIAEGRPQRITNDIMNPLRPPLRLPLL